MILAKSRLWAKIPFQCRLHTVRLCVQLPGRSNVGKGFTSTTLKQRVTRLAMVLCGTVCFYKMAEQLMVPLVRLPKLQLGRNLAEPLG